MLKKLILVAVAVIFIVNGARADGDEQVTPDKDVRIVYTADRVAYWSSKYRLAFSVPKKNSRIWAVEFGTDKNLLGEAYPFRGWYGTNFIFISDMAGKAIGRFEVIGNASLSQEEADKKAIEMIKERYERNMRVRGSHGRVSIELKSEKIVSFGTQGTRRLTYELGPYPREAQALTIKTSAETIAIFVDGIGGFHATDPIMEAIIGELQIVSPQEVVQQWRWIQGKWLGRSHELGDQIANLKVLSEGQIKGELTLYPLKEPFENPGIITEGKIKGDDVEFSVYFPQTGDTKKYRLSVTELEGALAGTAEGARVVFIRPPH